MKATIISVVSLLIGFLVGCGVGYRYNERYTTNEAIREMVDSEETSEAALASISTCAIALIDSGEPQKAVELLSSRVAHFTVCTG